MAKTNRYIGNLNVVPQRGAQRINVRMVTLSELVPADAIKLDCEGGEWALLADPRIKDVPLVFGEYHSGPGAEGVMLAFKGSHRVEFAAIGDATGNFRAVRR